MTQSTRQGHVDIHAIQPLAVSIDAAAQLTGQSRSALYDAIRRGELVARKRGRRTVILMRDMIAFMDALPAIPKH